MANLNVTSNYFDDRDREPGEPDWDAIAYAEHCEKAHRGGRCDCPPPTPEETEAYWAEQEKQHSAEIHDGGACDCLQLF